MTWDPKKYNEFKEERSKPFEDLTSHIIDKPNQRSSHTEITLRGGGIIFWFAALMYFLQHIESSHEREGA